MQPVDEVAVEDEVKLAQGIGLLHRGHKIVSVGLGVNSIEYHLILNLSFCLRHDAVLKILLKSMLKFH